MTLSIMGIGITYFLTDVAPFPFVDVTLGLSNWDDIEIDGPGIAVGVGAEFRPNWTAAVDLGWGNPKEGPDIAGIEWEVTGVTVGMHVSHIWY